MRHLNFLVFILAITTILGSPSANAARYFFSQGGFDQDGLGGRVTGSFEGVDIGGKLDENIKQVPDGMITMCSGRACPDPNLDLIKSFEIKFSGNPFFESVHNLREPHLTGLFYNIKRNGLEVHYGTNDTTMPDEGFFQYGWNSVNFILPNDTESAKWSNTSEPIFASQVPLPGALGLFIVSLPWLGLFRKKN